MKTRQIREYKYEDFTNKEKIGSGGQGSVYKAEHPDLGIVALKRFKSDQITYFKRELQVLESLKNPNIVKVLGITINPVTDRDGNESKRNYLILEFAENGDLENYLKKQNDIPWLVKAKWACDISDAIKSTHSNGMIHRDIKPSNILIYKDVRAKLSDFGGAKDDGIATTNYGGTNDFLSYQTLNTCIFTKENDMYAFGLVLFCIAINGLNELSFLDFVDIRNGNLSILDNFEIPASFLEIIKGCLCKETNSRFKINDVVIRLATFSKTIEMSASVEANLKEKLAKTKQTVKKLRYTLDKIKDRLLSEYSSIFQAIERGDIKAVYVFISIDPESVNTPNGDDKSYSPLQTACNFGQYEIVKLLIENGANVNSRDEENWTPLHCAVFGSNYKISKYLLRNNADVNAQCDVNYCFLQFSLF